MNRGAFVASVIGAAVLGGGVAATSKQFIHDSLPVEMSEFKHAIKIEAEREALNAPAILASMRNGSLAGVFDDSHFFDERETTGPKMSGASPTSLMVYTRDIYDNTRWVYINYGMAERETVREFARRVDAGAPVLDCSATYNPLTSDSKYELAQSDGKVVAYSAQRFEEFEKMQAVMVMRPEMRDQLRQSVADQVKSLDKPVGSRGVHL